jgi:uncharacterized protein (TIGR02453 family)
MPEISTLQFLQKLQKNNNREWFEQNRTQYEDARKDFSDFVAQLLQGHAAADKDLAELEAKNCVFRINRDVRFSKDKSPYKTNMGASMSKGGKKSNYAGYYFHLEPGASFAGGGLWMPEADVLKKIRQEIDYNFDEFDAILQQKSFKTVYKELSQDAEYKLSRPPKNYEADNPAIEFIKLKSFIALIPLTDEEVTSKNLLKKTLTAFAALQPVISFLNRAIDE